MPKQSDEGDEHQPADSVPLPDLRARLHVHRTETQAGLDAFRHDEFVTGRPLWLEERAAAITAALAKIDDMMIRTLLENWVSEFEPMIVRRQGDGAILGLAVDGDPTAFVCVAFEV
jgi:hypothetical protein